MNLQEPNGRAQDPGDRSSQVTLESWKEIAAYLQRDAKTASRWEKEEGLPLHRHNHKARSSVYAYPSEIDAWRASRKVVAEPPPPVPLWRSLFAPPRALAFGVTMLACLIMVGNGIRPVSAQQVRGSGTLAKRLVCTARCDDAADISPDERWLVNTDWDTGDLAVRDMSTGQARRLLAKTGTYKDSNADAGEPIFSPDLRQIVYLWESRVERESHDQLRVMPNEPGAKPRVLVDNPENTYYVPTAWFPDGKSVLVLLKKTDRTWRLARVSVSDGAVNILKSLEWRIDDSHRPLISPDGRYIVYSARAVNPSKIPPATTDPTDRHIYVLAADGSSETEIVKTAGINKNPVWTPDGKHILFTSDRSGKFDLWSVAMESGKPVGSALLVSSEIGDVYGVSLRGRSYYYYPNQLAGTEYVNIADFAPSGSNKETRVVHATESFVGIRPAWSPDGKSISFKRHHPGSANDYDVVVHSLETGDERTYLTKFGTSGPGGAVWSHDGKTIITGIGPGDASRSFYRIDLKTGEFKAVPVIGLPPFAFSPDDRTIYVSRNDEKDWAKLPAHILSVDLTSGKEKEIFTMPEPGYVHLLLTPDGRTLVIWQRADQKTQMVHSYRLNVDGTGYREISTIAQKDFRNNFTLTQDGRWILLAKRNDDKNWELIRIPIEGGAPESTGVVLDGALYERSLDLSPDGSRIAFTTMKRKRVEELWALDNVLSAIK
jgi:Tol biopolymer transport system component